MFVLPQLEGFEALVERDLNARRLCGCAHRSALLSGELRREDRAQIKDLFWGVYGEALALPMFKTIC